MTHFRETGLYHFKEKKVTGVIMVVAEVKRTEVRKVGSSITFIRYGYN